MITLSDVLLFILFLCWGSFLNAVGYRIIRNRSIIGRSQCTRCKATLGWYDLIPLVSYIILRGACRSCKKPISWLYPFIELLTALIFTLMIWYIDPAYWLAYGIFFSALIVTIRTDLELMLISRLMTWYLLPLALLFTLTHTLPLTFFESILGMLFGYMLLWIVAKLFYRWRKIEGLGEGDLDLMAFVGAYTGIVGVWFTLLIGSTLGTFIGLLLMAKYRKRSLKIPFGPWLAGGALLYVFLQNPIYHFIFLS